MLTDVTAALLRKGHFVIKFIFITPRIEKIPRES